MGVDIDINNIDSMKYNELRSLAKEIGIKANMKVATDIFFPYRIQ